VLSRTLDARPVGAIGLGCMGMTFAYAADPASDDPAAVVDRALDLGVTVLDTADVYGPFSNEELLGKVLGGRREAAFLATKCGLVVTRPEPLQVTPDGRPEHVRAAADGSLRRLGVDTIDLFQLHRVDPAVPLEDTWGAMAELVAAGKVRAVGMSEVTVDQLDRAAAIHPVAAVQSELSLWSREPLDGVVGWCERHGATFIAYSPLGRGFLTGAITAATAFGPADFRSQLPRFTPAARAANQAIVAALAAVAARHGAAPGQVALAWVLAQSRSIVAIPGTRRVARLEENAAAAELRLTAADLAELTAAPLPEQTRY
jgi:aryl-alcohol dehydrogenase-like predicted oxidoreductase